MIPMDATEASNTRQGWILVLLSSIACIIGASVVFIDKLWGPSHQSILESRAFLSASMALASGVLLFSSLAILLPASQNRLNSSIAMYLWFFGGALFTLTLTKIIHWCTPNAVHACGVDGPEQYNHHHHCLHPNHLQQQQQLQPQQQRHQPFDSPHSPSSSTVSTSGHSDINHSEGQPLKSHRHDDIEYGSMPFEESHISFHLPHCTLDHSPHSTSHSRTHSQHNDNSGFQLTEHHQHMLRIGIQTAIAIVIHKFPEGLIMFVSSQASEQLGWSVAAAMAVHNLTEGFMIALPLYFALHSRLAAFGWASLLGGLSQPFGAVLGLVLWHNIEPSQEDQLFGITFALVSGMMSLITVQSMLPQAIRTDTGHRYVVPFFFLGIFLVGLTSTLKSV